MEKPARTNGGLHMETIRKSMIILVFMFNVNVTNHNKKLLRDVCKRQGHTRIANKL
jgi:hypothetical protein